MRNCGAVLEGYFISYAVRKRRTLRRPLNVLSRRSIRPDFFIPARYSRYNCSVGNAQVTGHGDPIEQPTVDGIAGQMVGKKSAFSRERVNIWWLE
jgi:hypothetical protein